MAVLATPATHDGSDFERRKRMATEQIGEPCHWERAEEENSALFPPCVMLSNILYGSTGQKIERARGNPPSVDKLSRR